MHNFLEKFKLNILFLVINAMCIYLKIQHFHGVKENRGISDTTIKLKGVCYDFLSN